MKSKGTVFFCKECGYESPKWMGQCPGCKEWNTFMDEPVSKKSASIYKSSVNISPIRLDDISMEQEDRLLTGISEIDRVLGGGLVKSSLVLVGGDPGIGKSTILLQVCKELSNKGAHVLYVSGEESLKQIKMRANRIGTFGEYMSLLCETNLENVEQIIEANTPEIVVIDSIQTMFKEDVGAAPGSVSQVREATNTFLRLAKGLSIVVFIVGHVTKEGVVAGPRVLEHMVDTVLYFEGDRHASYRILRGVKNRFGSTNEIGVFEMKEDGLKEVMNPSEYMLSGRPEQASGTVITCSVEGTRPILLEMQALVCRTNFGLPRRTSAGTDYNRVNLLIAVLEKRLGIQMSECDAYVNIAGGMKVNEPSLDLAIMVSLISSYKDIVVNDKTVVFGEVGLSGEVRAVSYAEQRVNEALKLGFEVCVMPKSNLNGMKVPTGMKVIGVSNIKEVMNWLVDNYPNQ